MKKSLFALALLAVLAGSAAFATNQLPAKQKPVDTYTYYLQDACDTPVICSDENEGQLCSVAFEETVVYYQPTCSEIHTVASPLGKLPL